MATEKTIEGNSNNATEIDPKIIEEYLAKQSKQTVHSGDFWGIKIGDTKDGVMERLKALGIVIVGPEWAGPIVIQEMTQPQWSALQASHLWRFNHHNSDGFWKFTLLYKEHRLDSIIVHHSPFEFF